MVNLPLIHRAAEELILEAFGDSRIVGIIGPRQSGKTTLVRDVLAPRLGLEYLTLDNPLTRVGALSDPVGFLADVKGAAVIDEIQRAPDLMLAIKERVDRDPAPGQFIITGSANLQRIGTVQDALPGRVDYIRLWPLSQAEIEGAASEFLVRVLAGEPPDVEGASIGSAAALSRFCAGGFPGVFRKPSTARRRFFDSYVGSIVERDIPDIAEVRSDDGPARLLRLVAARSAGILNLASISRDLRLDEKTAATYLRILEDLMLVRRHRAWFANLGSRQTKQPKVYISDPGLLVALLELSEDGVQRDSTLVGSVLETGVVMEIVRMAATHPGSLEVMHYRDDKKREVDVMLETPDGRVIAIEVKAGATPATEDFKVLRYLRDRLGARFVFGLVMFTGERTVRFGDRLAAVPISGLWGPPG